ncbi:MAG TPA: transcriptional regulator [Ruminococcaceae bacterium]|nr:transcriptional regulator [Oscillospiraceae bacterium]
MPVWGIALILFTTFILFAFIHFLSKIKRPFSRAFLSMSLGAGLLAAINLTSSFTGVYIPVSLLSVFVSVIGGVPGVTLLLFLNLFL